MRQAGQRFLLALLVLASLGTGVITTAVADHDLLPPADLIPSRPVGEEVFAQHCAACHAPEEFDSRTWRHDIAPVRLVATVLGQHGDHPEAVTSLADAWHAAAYIWTVPLDPEDVARGVELVQHAQGLAQNQGLIFLLVHSDTITALQDRAWVLSRPPATVQEHLRQLAGADLDTLTEEELGILVDHIFVTHFALPEGWR